jgi:hypothetical protein
MTLESSQRRHIGSPAARAKGNDRRGSGRGDASQGSADQVELDGLLVVANVGAAESVRERHARIREPLGVKVQADFLLRIVDRFHDTLENGQAESKRKQGIDEKRGLQLAGGERLELKR